MSVLYVVSLTLGAVGVVGIAAYVYAAWNWGGVQ